MLSAHSYLVSYHGTPIVASSLTQIMKLPDFDPSRTSVDKRSLNKYVFVPASGRNTLLHPPTNPISGLLRRYATANYDKIFDICN